MGMYTSVDLTLPLKLDTPQPVIDFLNWLINTDYLSENREQAPARHGLDHEFFKDYNWSSVFWGGGGERFKRPQFVLGADQRYTLSISGAVKNSQSTVKAFANWISPFVDEQPDVIHGEWRYEEWHGWSTIRMGADGQLIMKPWREPEPQGMW